MAVGSAGHVDLCLGDGRASGDFVALYSGDNPNCYLTKNGFHAPPPKPGDPTRTVTLTLNITGRDANDLWDNYRKLETKLRQARAAQGPYGLGQGVTLGVRFDAQNTMVFFDVLDGLLTTDQNLTALFPIPFIENVSLQLICLPYARGLPITDAVSATITNGTAATLYRAQIPGDVPALARMTLTDVSTNSKVINRWRIGQLALPHMASGDFSPAIDATAVLPGTATTDSSSYLGAAFSRITTTTDWQTIATVSKPSAQYTTGLFDVWVRARDAAVLLGPPTGLTSVQGGITVARRGSNFAYTASSVAVTWTATTVAGSLLLMRVTWYGGTLTVPASWTLAKSQPGTGVTLALYYIENAAAHSGAETVSLSSAANIGVSLYEVTGIAASASLDTTAGGSGNSTTWSTGATATLTQAHELVFAAASTSPPGSTGNPPSGYTGVGGPYASDSWEEVNATTAITASAGMSSANFAALVATFKGVTASLPSMPAGLYVIQVSALDSHGDESVTSSPTVYNLAATGAIATTWVAPTVGTAVGYRLYFDSGSGMQYFDTGSTATSYSLTTTTGAITGSPSSGNSTLSAVRAQLGLASGTILFDQPAFLCQRGGSTWEMVYVGTLDLPPQSARDGGTPPNWMLQLQGTRAGAPVTLDIDGVWLIPHFWSQITTTYNDGRGMAMNLVTKRKWVIDTHRDGRTTVQLQSTVDGSEAGQAITTGHLYLGPGDTTLVFMPDITDGASDVTDAKFTAQLTITPRFALVSGVPF